MMKKKGIVLSIALVVGILMIGTAAAGVEITTSTQVVGNGTYDAEILMQSSNVAEGLKYWGEMYTPALGMFGPSEVILSTEYMLTQNNESELMMSEESEITNIRSKRCFKNYDLGTLQAFNTFGDYSVLSEFGGDRNISMMMVEAEVSGKVLTEVTVRGQDSPHYYIVHDRAKYNGDNKLWLSSLIEWVEEPRADMCDWLGCP